MKTINNIEDPSNETKNKISLMSLIADSENNLNQLAIEACKNGNLSLIHYLFASDALSHQTKENILLNNNLLLTRACQFNHINIVEYLLSSSTMNDFIHRPNIRAKDYECLEFAVKNSSALVKLLLENIKEDDFTFKNHPDIFVEAANGSIETLKLIIDFEKSKNQNINDLINVVNKYDINILIFSALQDKNNDMLKYLIEDCELKEYINFTHCSQMNNLSVFSAAAKVGAINNTEYLWNLRKDSTINIHYDIENIIIDLIKSEEYKPQDEIEKNKVIQFLILESDLEYRESIKRSLQDKIPTLRKDFVDKIFSMHDLNKKLHNITKENNNKVIHKNKI